MSISRFESLFLRSLRNVLPEYKVATDDFLIKKIEKRLTPATEEIVCLLQSAGATIGLQYDIQVEALMTRCLQLLADFIQKELHLSPTLKHILDCLSYTGPAITKKYPYAFKWGIVPWELVPNFTNKPHQQLSAR